MPCHLHVRLNSGARDLAARLRLEPYHVAEAGEPIAARPGKSHDAASLSFDVSAADFDQLPSQFDDAVRFLREHETDVRLLAAEGEAFLDFGHEPRDASVQIDTLPQELVRLAAEFDVRNMFSLYLFETYDDEEESTPVPRRGRANCYTASDLLDISYDLGEAGWATATVRSSECEVHMTASYLNDPLRDLAEATLRLCAGVPEATIVFMDEPGEHHLVLSRSDDGRLAYEVRWFDDWASWGMHPPDRYSTVLRGETTVRRLRHQVVNILWELDETFGPDQYQVRWVNAEFPTAAYTRLRAV